MGRIDFDDLQGARNYGLARRLDGTAVTANSLQNRKPKTANKLAYDTAMTARLWQVSAAPVGLRMS